MLRHACGYALVKKGHDTRRIQNWLGHRSIQHTVRYNELSAAPFRGLWRDRSAKLERRRPKEKSIQGGVRASAMPAPPGGHPLSLAETCVGNASLGYTTQASSGESRPRCAAGVRAE
jgi:hypothetical protein